MKRRSPVKASKSRKAKSLKRRNANRGRGLRFESLEDRRLLAFGNPIVSVEGMSDNPLASVSPPDTVGAVGLDYYLQSVNTVVVEDGRVDSAVAVFSKDDGELLTEFTMGTLAPSTSDCALGTAGDPMVIFDHLANRWVLLQFAQSLTGDEIDTLCFYVSDTSNVLSTNWQTYEFLTGSFPDYPKLGLHQDAYFVGTNDVGANDQFPAAYAFDRENMLSGGTVRPFQKFAVTADLGSFPIIQPADLDGPAPPPGTPGYFARRVDEEASGVGDPLTDYIEVFEFNVDWDQPANTTFQTVDRVLVNDFDSTVCDFAPDCIPQPGGPGLDSLADVGIMYRLQYRNFDEYETLVGSFGVALDGLDHAGVRWFELRKENAADVWRTEQEGDINYDALHRWNSSPAMDQFGNIAVGYNVSGPTTSPGIRYTGRLADDPAGQMSRGEHILVTGRGYVEAAGNRWGDYSTMTVDPVDDQTFWYTAQKADNTFWSTQVGSFRFDAPDPAPPEPEPIPGEPVSISGVKWHDLDANGVFDLGESGLGGILIYADLDNDRQFDLNEPGTTTDSRGRYSLDFTSSVNLVSVREKAPPGWTSSFPELGSYQLALNTSLLGTGTLQEFENVDFGNVGQAFDLGDAPAPYPVSIADDGPRHGVLGGFHLGAALDGEADSLNTAGSDGDGSDEDGITFTSGLFSGGVGTVDVVVSTNGHSPGRLQGFVDFNNDGDWNDLGEQIIANQKLTEGTHSLSFLIPATANGGLTYARFRYGYENGIGATGPALAGEVEDYSVTVLGNRPQAADDAFTVAQDSSGNLLDVLANDQVSSAGGISISNVSGTDLGGSVQILQNGSSLSYSPPAGAFGIDTFTYTVSDGTPSGSSSATVTVSITPTFADPVAVDDYVTDVSPGPNVLAVLANDIVGPNGPIEIEAVTQPDNGVVSVPAGRQAVIYTPNPGFEDLDQFTYTIVDATGATSSGAVSVQVSENAADNDLVAFSLVVTNQSGTEVSAVELGDTFLVHAFADDLRTEDPNTATPADDRGVGAAYMDLLYDASRVTVLDVAFATECGDCLYPNATSADTSTPNVINDAGGLQSEPTALGSEPTKIFVVTMQAIAAGEVSFQTDPTEQSPAFDTVFFEPTEAVSRNRITFGSGTVSIVGAGTPPQAIDDSFAAGSQDLNPLDNDLSGSNGQASIVAVGPTSAGGAVTITNNGASVAYTAPQGAAVTDQFTYTIEDSIGLQSTALITVHGSDANDVVHLRVDVADENGNSLGSQPISVGDEFQLNVFVTDLRGAGDDRGIYAAYLDLLYERGLTAVNVDTGNAEGYDITCGIPYSQFPSDVCNIGQVVDASTAGIVNEAGGVQFSQSPLGSEEFHLLSIGMTATSSGVATFTADPANGSPGQDTLTFEPAEAVSFDQIRYGSDSVTIVSAVAEGEATNTNPVDPYDVNDDGARSPVDALLVVKDLNRQHTGAAEGEASAVSDAAPYLDVNADGNISPIDALLVISALNQRASAAGEAAVQGSAIEVAPTEEVVALGDALWTRRESVASLQLTETPLVPTPAVTSDSQDVTGWLAAARHAAINDVTALDAAVVAASSYREDLVADELLEDLANGWKRN
ncbi:MAG: Ig-like domain-containing protein [Planctomycetota bacterium]|nr:Ig-like domain-containing protein [Planctomycetota bacterium]